MKLLLFADLHLDAPFVSLASQPGAAQKRRQALRDTLERIVDLAARSGADAILGAGDLYEHERYTPDTAAFVRDVFARARPMRVFLAPGNHDWLGPGSLYRHVDWTDNVHVFREDRLQPVTLVDGLTLWGAAHRAPANTDGFLERFHTDRGGQHIALFHGSERGWLAAQEGGKIPHAPFSSEQIAAAGLDHAFVGHFHRPRDDRHFTYPGNPDPLTFGEDDEGGAVLATLGAAGSLTRERHRVAVTTVHDLRVDVSGCASQQEVRERVRVETQSLNGVARVTLYGEVGMDAELHPQELRDVAPWLDALVIRCDAVQTAYDLEAIAQEPTVRGQFVRDVRAADLPEDEQRRVLVTGLRALQGRDDLEVL